MKSFWLYICILLSFLILPFLSFGKNSSGKVKKIVINECKDVSLSGDLEVEIKKGKEYYISVRSEGKSLVYKSEGEKFFIEGTSESGANENKIYLVVYSLSSLSLEGNVKVTINKSFKAYKLHIKTSGNSVFDAKLDVQKLTLTSVDNSFVFLKGKAKYCDFKISKDASLDASNLDVKELILDSGTTKPILVSAQSVIRKSGDSPVLYNNDKYGKVIVRTEDSQNKTNDTSKDTLLLKYRMLSMKIIGDEISQMSWGRNIWNFKSTGISYYREKYRKVSRFNGHWAGVSISVNGYMSGPFDISMPAGYDYMKLRYEKSAGIYLNLFEVNLTLARKGRSLFGMFTGLGYEFHNYRLDNNTVIDRYNGTINPFRYIDQDGASAIVKSKLAVEYVTAPLIFEYQWIGNSKIADFHIGAGVVVGVTTFSRTKVKFFESNMSYKIADYNTGEILAVKDSPSRKVYKDKGSLGITPFKCDAIVTIGFGGLNFFITHSLNNMFKGGQGPKLYPWSVGIMLIGW